MMYKVEHYHRKMFGSKGTEDIAVLDAPTTYTIEAETPLQAAKMAHAMYNGCDDFSTGGEYRTRFERLTDDIREDTYFYKTFVKDTLDKNRKVYIYDDVGDHRIWVTWQGVPNIQEFIKTSGMTQKQLSERFGIPKRTIEEWSRGARKCPDYVVRMMDEILRGGKMKFKVSDIAYEIKKITAIASCDNENEEDRQDALLVIADNGTETTEHVVFGWTMPEDEETFEEMCEDASAWEPLEDSHKIR